MLKRSLSLHWWMGLGLGLVSVDESDSSGSSGQSPREKGFSPDSETWMVLASGAKGKAPSGSG